MEQETRDNHKLLNTYEKLQIKLAKEKNRRCFLLRCKHLNLVPNCVKIKDKSYLFKNVKNKSKFTGVLSRFYVQLLNLCICDSNDNIKIIERDACKIRRNIAANFEDQFTNNYFMIISEKYDNVFNRVKKITSKKLTIW